MLPFLIPLLLAAAGGGVGAAAGGKGNRLKGALTGAGLGAMAGTGLGALGIGGTAAKGIALGTKLAKGAKYAQMGMSGLQAMRGPQQQQLPEMEAPQIQAPQIQTLNQSYARPMAPTVAFNPPMRGYYG